MWATIEGDNQNNILPHNELSAEAATEEASLHGLRSRYNDSMKTLSASHCSNLNALNCLRQVSQDAKVMIERYNRSKMELLSISYLADKNRLEFLSELPESCNHECYGLALELVQTMLELNKCDILLIYKTARLALSVGDVWTYKQLILLHQTKLPYMYGRIIAAEFGKTIKQNYIRANNISSGILRFLQRSKIIQNNQHSKFNENDLKLTEDRMGFFLDIIITLFSVCKTSSYLAIDLVKESLLDEVYECCCDCSTKIDGTNIDCNPDIEVSCNKYYCNSTTNTNEDGAVGCAVNICKSADVSDSSSSSLPPPLIGIRHTRRRGRLSVDCNISGSNSRQVAFFASDGTPTYYTTTNNADINDITDSLSTTTTTTNHTTLFKSNVGSKLSVTDAVIVAAKGAAGAKVS